MKHVLHSDLKTLVQSLFEKSGCSPHESERIAHYLIEANLTGHDSVSYTHLTLPTKA